MMQTVQEETNMRDSERGWRERESLIELAHKFDSSSI